ncbi:MAG: glycosyltransferase family 39 protein [Candidatus Paceibacterota bacterium]
MQRNKKQELAVFLLIVGVASFFRLYQLDKFPPGLYPDEAMNGNNALQAIDTGEYKIFYPENNGREGLFINIQAMSVKAFGNEPWALRLVSAIFGILTVAGLYFLTRQLYDWRMASLASFLLAVSFWHVNFSRIGFRAIMLPFVLVWGFYFLWRGLKHSHKFDFLMAGIFAGIGFHTYISYRVAPLIAVLLFLNYWWYLKQDFSHHDYEHARNRLLQGFALTFLAMVIVALPIGLYFWFNAEDLVGRAASLSVLSGGNIIRDAANSTLKTLAMFNFMGDWNWRHNIGGAPLLHWTVGIFFVIGFFKELGHWLKRKHGHFSTLHTFLLSWFFIMLIPGFISYEAPHALRAIGAIPVVMIFAARGIWWMFDKLSDWYKANDPHSQHERHVAMALVLVIFLSSIGFVEYWRYFRVWGPSPDTASAFNQNYADVADAVNQSPANIKKYVLVNASGVLVNGIPMPAQTVMFLTDTYTADKQKQRNIFYLTKQQFNKGDYDKGGLVFPLEK